MIKPPTMRKVTLVAIHLGSPMESLLILKQIVEIVESHYFKIVPVVEKKVADRYRFNRLSLVLSLYFQSKLLGERVELRAHKFEWENVLYCTDSAQKRHRHPSLQCYLIVINYMLYCAYILVGSILQRIIVILLGSGYLLKWFPPWNPLFRSRWIPPWTISTGPLAPFLSSHQRNLRVFWRRTPWSRLQSLAWNHGYLQWLNISFFTDNDSGLLDGLLKGDWKSCGKLIFILVDLDPPSINAKFTCIKISDEAKATR